MKRGPGPNAAGGSGEKHARPPRLPSSLSPASVDCKRAGGHKAALARRTKVAGRSRKRAIRILPPDNGSSNVKFRLQVGVQARGTMARSSRAQSITRERGCGVVEEAQLKCAANHGASIENVQRNESIRLQVLVRRSIQVTGVPSKRGGGGRVRKQCPPSSFLPSSSIFPTASA
jgi:hypothetical protein